MAKEISFDIAARKKMETGVNKLADTVKITLGPCLLQRLQWQISRRKSRLYLQRAAGQTWIIKICVGTGQLYCLVL